MLENKARQKWDAKAEISAGVENKARYKGAAGNKAILKRDAGNKTRK